MHHDALNRHRGATRRPFINDPLRLCWCSPVDRVDVFISELSGRECVCLIVLVD